LLAMIRAKEKMFQETSRNKNLILQKMIRTKK